MVTTTERGLAEQDAEYFGAGYIVDGMRVHPSRVEILRREVTTTDLWNALAAVLVAKGAKPEWIAYALPDLQIAASQYGTYQYGRGYDDSVRLLDTKDGRYLPRREEQTLGQTLAEHGTGGDTYD